MGKFLHRIKQFVFPIIAAVLIITATYLLLDQFKVLNHYSYFHPSGIITNRDYTSTEMYLTHNPQYHYNSFIFGSSRTLAFRPSEWARYLADDASPFVFDASSESIFGIWCKIHYIDSTQQHLENALLLFCHDCTFDNERNQEGHLFVKHPETTKTSKLNFQLEFFKVYKSPRFFIPYWLYKATGKYSSYMEGVIDNREIAVDSITNAVSLIQPENALRTDPERYYSAHAGTFGPERKESTDRRARITPAQYKMLEEIKRIFEKHKTNYRVILSPLYDREKFSKMDIQLLQHVFGKTLFDFTGSNFITTDKSNYYESSHYRPLVGDTILNLLYPDK